MVASETNVPTVPTDCESSQVHQVSECQESGQTSWSIECPEKVGRARRAVRAIPGRLLVFAAWVYQCGLHGILAYLEWGMNGESNQPDLPKPNSPLIFPFTQVSPYAQPAGHRDVSKTPPHRTHAPGAHTRYAACTTSSGVVSPPVRLAVPTSDLRVPAVRCQSLGADYITHRGLPL